MSRHPARGDFDPIPSARRQVEISVDELASLRRAGRGPGRAGRVGCRAARRPRDRRRPPRASPASPASAGEHLVVPGADGRALVALGIGDASTVDLTRVRDLAADFARAVPQHLTLAVELPEGVDRHLAGRLRPGRRRGGRCSPAGATSSGRAATSRP